MISSLTLINFRNYSSASFRFSTHVTCIVGNNAIGKTNLLESLFLLSHAKSFHAAADRDMIHNGKEIGRVKGDIIAGEEKTEVEIVLTVGNVMGQNAPLKSFFINSVGKRMVDFIGTFKTVLFWPEDLELVTGSPSKRRRYLDFVLSNVDREYRRTLISYEKGLRNRNKLLENLREGKAHRHQLLFWDQLLIKDGDYLTSKRQEYIKYLNSQGKGEYFSIYDMSIISRARLDQYANAEIAAGVTLVGPHRDDLKFYISYDKQEKRDLARFGSRGEQRLAILWLKMTELAFIEDKTSQKPTLLLDDIFSELDHVHRDLVIGMCGKQQTILSTTDAHFIEGMKSPEMKLIEL